MNETFDEACQEHAARIIDFLEHQTNGNWQECLDVARAELERTGSPLWLAVCEGLRVLIRQDAVNRSERLHGVLASDDDVPY
ncbi:MAG: hypothetical protein CML68_04505 [Rhodobacteraceae bacterium]|nr:hypothetical protein [Paracoccaceae bacterium]